MKLSHGFTLLQKLFSLAHFAVLKNIRKFLGTPLEKKVDSRVGGWVGGG
jgi:hypothetical protein